MSQLLNYIIRFLKFILFGNIYVALGAVCLIQSTSIQLQLSEYIIPYSFLVFFATLFIYNFQRFFYKPQIDNSLNSVRRKWIFENQTTIKALTLIGLAGVSISYYFNNSNVLFYLSPLLVLSLAYFISFLKLRKNPFFKLFTLVLVWTMVTAVVPLMMNGGAPFDQNNLIHFALRFCFMMAICIPFDIRDIQIDMADKVYTLPYVIGETKAKLLAVVFMLAFLCLIFVENAKGIIEVKMMVALVFSALINAVPILMSNSKRGEYFYVAWLDGTMILQGLVLMLAKFLL